MRSVPMGKVLPQTMYAAHLEEMNAHVKEFMKLAAPAEVEKYKRFMNLAKGELHAPMDQTDERELRAKELIKMRSRLLQKAGLTSSIGYNFFDLRGPAYLIYPVNVPFRNMLPRIGRVNDGYGTAAHWKATRNFGTQYGGVVEGQRNALATPDENDYTATYKELGIERGATFTSQFAGEGYTDNVADEHLRGLHELWLQEESLMLLGNSGTASGNNGFVLGTMNTPTAALAAGGSLANALKVSGFVVAITALGNPNNAQYGYNVAPSVANGLVPNFTRANYDGSTTPVNAGVSQISAGSNIVTTGGGNNSVTFTATPKAGAFAYAWYVDITDAVTPTLANAFLAGITTFPTFTLTANPTGTQTGAAVGLSSDHSSNIYDFDGLLTWAITQGRFVDMAGANLTKAPGGSVVELDADLQFLWTNFQAQPKNIWCAVDAKINIDNTILASSPGGAAEFRFNITPASNGQNLIAGFVVASYRSKFGVDPSGSISLPLRIHPMLPPGSIYYDIEDNPYPHSRLPFVRGMLVQRDYYSIEWPLVTRQWTFGTYVHEVLAHNIPWISGLRAGIGGAGT